MSALADWDALGRLLRRWARRTDRDAAARSERAPTCPGIGAQPPGITGHGTERSLARDYTGRPSLLARSTVAKACRPSMIPCSLPREVLISRNLRNRCSA